MTREHQTVSLRPSDLALAYTFLRIVTGVNYFNHGFTRLNNIPGFAQSMVEMFQDTFVPDALVRGPAYLVPIVELVAGLLVTLGLFTRTALAALFGLMIVLMYGVTLLQNWDTAMAQLVYCLVLFLLIAANRFNAFSLDRLFKRRQQRTDK